MPEMIPTPESSNVESIGYDDQNEEIWVVFRKSGSYYYPGVPEFVWEEFCDSSSKGKYVNEVLKVNYTGYRV